MAVLIPFLFSYYKFVYSVCFNNCCLHSMNYHQDYIPHEYLELRMPAGPSAHNGGIPTFLLDPNHLHIWPRHSFMLIALPNQVSMTHDTRLQGPSLLFHVYREPSLTNCCPQDKSFTCTLFAPTAEFDRLTTPENIVDWFGTNFPDALPLIGEKALLRDFERNPRSPLISIKVR